jgi:hypothetical protein
MELQWPKLMERFPAAVDSKWNKTLKANGFRPFYLRLIIACQGGRSLVISGRNRKKKREEILAGGKQ